MNREQKSLFSNLFGFKKEKPATPVVLTGYSQPHVLQQRMKEANLTHGDRVLAKVGPVRLESNFGKMVLYFCAADKVKVSLVVEPGDGGSLPEEATVHNLSVPDNFKPGLYELENVELFSNGTLQVISRPETKFVPI